MADFESPRKRRINLLRGWPAPELLPVGLLRDSCVELFEDPDVYIPALQYGPDPGPEELREELSHWLARTYNVAPDASRLCITGGASQNLARILQTFTDPHYTRAVWMVAPCYFMACPIFEDAGFAGRLKAVPEDAEGIDIEHLASRLRAMDSDNSPQPPVSSTSVTEGNPT
jgi:DNA-binding transcriptional MocR family regulator